MGLEEPTHNPTNPIHNVDNIILGAFGCGAFSNDPEVISSVFKRILIDEEYFKYFVNVHFAIFCANIETGNFILVTR